MAVYKPTYCYPYLEAVDLTIPDGEKYFTCQIDTSNIKITGYRVELYNENNEKVFPLNKGKISPLSELNDTGNTSGLNGSELRFPFVQHWDPKIYPSYNAIYFKATNYVDYYQAQLSDSIVANGRTIYKNKGVLVEVDRDSSVTNEEIQRQYIGKYVLLNGNMLLVTSENCVNVPITTLGSGERSGPEAYSPIFVSNGQLFEDEDTQFNIDDSFVFVGDTLLIGEALYTADYNGLYLKRNLSEGAIVYIKGGAINAGKILQYQNGELVDSAESAWCDVNGNSLAISNKGKTYKWQITLYSGERGAIRTTGANGAVEISYDSMADNEFNTVLTSGTILGSTADRIQGPISDKIYAKQWLQLLKKDEKNNWVQVGTRTYIESYSQTLGYIYPVSGDSRGFNNSDLYDVKTVMVNDEEKVITPATHFAVYKYSNNPNFITSQTSVDESINFVLTAFGASHVDGSYSYEVTGNAQIKKFNDKCIKEGSNPLCEINPDGTSGVYSGKSVLIWNEPSTTSTTRNPLTGYFTISFSLVNGITPKFVFDMVYAYRKVSSYIGKVFFVKGGSFANENIVSKAEAIGEQDVASLGIPIDFANEEPLEIYPNATDKLHGKIFKNSAGKVYISPFVGLQAGARLYVSDGTVIKAQTVDTTTWAVTYAATAPASTSAYSSTNPLKYEIRTNFKSSDETPFYAYDTPRLVPWSEQALSVIGTNGYEFLLESMGQILTVPIIFSSEIHARYVHVVGQYLQAQNASWTSYRWLLVDEHLQVIQDTGKQYDGLIETTFYGLNGPKVSDVEAGKAIPTVYYPVLIVEDELGNSLIMGMKIEVSLNPRNLPMEFSGGFDCKTQSVIMKIKDYGYPKFSKDLDNKATVLDANQGVNYPTEAEIESGKKFVLITGENKSFKAADQVKIPTQGAQLKHFFAKDTVEISNLSKAPKKLATNDRGNVEFHTKVKLDANFCGEILKYSVDIFDTFGNTDKLNILLELPNNFNPQPNNDKLNGERNKVKCTVSTKDSSASASGIALFDLPSGNQEAYYLQPVDWIDGNGNIKDSNKQSLEYLDFVHPFDASGAEQESYTNINESINIKEDNKGVSRDVGVCCLQQANATTGNNLFNKWTDLKRIKVTTPVGPRVVQTAEPAVWNDTDSNDNPNIWTEGWNDDYDTKMVQVKRHAKVAEFTWEINGYLREIDALHGQSLKVTASSDANGSVWKVYKETQFNGDTLVEGEEPYITIQMKKEA